MRPVSLLASLLVFGLIAAHPASAFEKNSTWTNEALSSQGLREPVPRASAILAQAFADPLIYAAGRCGDNVFRLGQRLVAEGLDLTSARVIYVLYENRKIPPVPVLMRARYLEPGPHRGTEDWFFHAVLTIQDEVGQTYVFDLDSSPQPIPVLAFFETLFPNLMTGTAFASGDRLQNIYVRTSPWQDYQELFARLGSGDAAATWMRDEKTNPQPILALRAYLLGL